MALHWFDPPVYVVTPKVGECCAVTSVERAAEFLVSWRRRGGQQLESAIESCIAAIRDQAPAETAREAFEAAARESRKLL